MQKIENQDLNLEKIKDDLIIELINVKKNYGSNKILKGINLEIKSGDRIGVIGPNGAGKSTLSEIITGIRKPSSGNIVKKENLKIGIQFQESKYPVGITVYDLILYYLEIYSIKMTKNELEALMQTYQILDLKNKSLEKLSGGQQQRVNIMLGLIHNPDFVIFDEISTGLDIEVRQSIFDFIKEMVIDKGKSMILVTHMMQEIEDMCNKFVYIYDGKILECGEINDLIEKYGSVHNYTWEMFKKYKHKKRRNLTKKKINLTKF
ncbi:ABC transporter ATP-binding protein [Spiroplasma endosymbiont of Labia minor]|uniref:ABC transporter ATP-binding protein n=1 Tax=Spiroplasma endosymbiont of Labia minor TaxID=3066305 RepID=UPI0030D12834